MQDQRHADLRPQVLRIGGNGAQRFGGDREQEVVEHRLVGVGEGKRRIIRVLVPHSKTFYYVENGRARGVSSDIIDALAYLERGKDRSVIERRVHLRGPLDDEQRTRLPQIANACPAHRLLTGQVEIPTVLAA